MEPLPQPVLHNATTRVQLCKAWNNESGTCPMQEPQLSSKADDRRTNSVQEATPMSSNDFAGSQDGIHPETCKTSSARPVPIASSHREEAIGVSHAQIRGPTGKLAPPQNPGFPGSPEGINPETCKTSSARPVPIASSHREEAIGVSHAQIRGPTGKLASGLIRDFCSWLLTQCALEGLDDERAPSTELIPDAAVLIDLEAHARSISSNLDMVLRDLRGSLRGMSDVTLESSQIFSSTIGSSCDAVDASIKSTYTMLAKAEELNTSMEGVRKFSQQVKDIKRLVDLFETHFGHDSQSSGLQATANASQNP
ncbi:BLOC-1-related complex sub-unit 6 domain-containing protein [Ditylenchus destructor]|nr:BLOC-1-related complex sub-unit 6 domain-containing protein [Ditylenchus destructor]